MTDNSAHADVHRTDTEAFICGFYMLRQAKNRMLYPSDVSHRFLRGMIALALTGFAMVVSFHLATTTYGAEHVGTPNIIYILADDLGYGDLRCYGQRNLWSPRIDRMAAEGMRFTQHYAGATVCAPSRCVLLTGLHSGHTRIRNNTAALLADDDPTIAKLLRAADYRTGCVGKWGLGHPPEDDDPARCGFDYFYGYINMYHAHNFFPEFIIRNGQRVPLKNELGSQWKSRTDGAGIAVKKVDYVPELVHGEALSYIKRNKDRPFFLYYALNMPHANNEGRHSVHGMEVDDYGEFLRSDLPLNEKGFARMIQLIDRYVGEVIDLLQELDLDSNTLVIFSSDNGPHQEGGHMMEYFNSNGVLRGMKRDFFEGGIRVPMIARWPGQIEPGSTSDLISGFQDMLPTFAEIAGVSPYPNDGISMVPSLLGNNDQQEKHRHLYWEFPQKWNPPGAPGPIDVQRQAVRWGRWKAVRDDIGGKVTMELYDLKTDVGEKNNIAAEHPAILAEINRIMEQESRPVR